MAVRKLIILILSVIISKLSVFGTSSVLGIKTTQQNESEIKAFGNTQVNNELRNEFVEHKRMKRDDNTNKVSYVLNGFLENGTIPIDFPKDICLFELEEVLYASVLHFSDHPQSTLNQKTLFTIFKRESNGEYIIIFKHETQSAIDMDCISVDGKGFVAISNTIENEITDLNEGSPIFQVTGNNVVIAQYFSMPFQNGVYLRRHGNHIYFVQSIFNKLNKPSICPIFRWSGYHFDLLDELPCAKALKIEPFGIGSDIYIAVANYKDEFDEIETFSFIYKFNVEHKRFLLHQQIRTHAVVDVKFFEIKDEQFLVFANSYEKVNDGGVNNETWSIIYKLNGDYFTPFQSIILRDVIEFLPFLGPRNEFILLISCKRQDIQTWQYNGWSFNKTVVQFTGGALGQGVSNMRNYLLEGSMVIVVANAYMLEKDSNIFFPQFVFKEDTNVLHKAIEKCCNRNMNRVNSVADAKYLATELVKLPNRNFSEETVINNIHFQEVSIDTITTQSLQTKTLVENSLANKIINVNNIVQQLHERITNIGKKMSPEKVSSNLMADVAHEPFVKKTTLFEYGDNNLQSEAQVTHTNEIKSKYTEKSLEFDEITILETINVEFINGRPFKHLVCFNRDLNVTDVKVNELIIRNYENYKEIIGKANKNSDHEEIVAESSSSFVVPQSGVVDTVVTKSLLVNGFINRLDLSTLNEFALKLRGDQVIESEMNFHILRGSSLQTNSSISQKNINDIVRTVDGPFAIDRPIRFTEPVIIKELIVNQRINNINVDKGEFDILLKRSDRVQVIQGLKIFDEVKLENPIVLQGKIKKSNLNQINPIVSISDDIILEGDYEIIGNTTIIRGLRGENIYGNAGTYNVKELLINGLPLNTPVIEAIFEFIQPIKTTNLISNSVNNVDVSKFVRTGEIQNIYATKNFKGDLHVTNGFCDAIIINGVNLAVLNETILKRTATQTVEGKIHFTGIRSNRTSAKAITLFGHKFNDYLTKTDQIIPGKVIINGNLIVNNIEIDNLRTNNTICQYDLGSIIADTITTTMDSQNSIVTGEKVFTNDLTLNNVQIGGNVFQLGTMESILGYLNLLMDDVKLDGPITFNDLSVDKLTFTQSINGISSADFGTQWMLSETDQDFTAPQAAYSITTVEDVILNGSFNNLNLEEQFELTQFRDQPITFKTATFARATFQQAITLNGLVSGIKFPNDVILKDADFVQSLSDHVVFNNLNVSGSVSLLKLNSIDYAIACDLISPEVGPYGLIITHDAKFIYVPQIENLNGWNVNQLYNDVWLTNANVQLTGTPTFADVEFTKPIQIKGLFNGRDIGFIAGHYVSLTIPQEVISTINIQGNVLYQGAIRTGSVQLDGIIKDDRSGRGIKIEEFDQTVLKKDIDQEITAQWYIMEAEIYGDLNTLVNGFDLAHDVVRYSSPVNNVTAVKTFEIVTVRNLNCQIGCTLMNVNVGEWIGRVALNGANYTIQGTTVIDAAVFYNNLNVFGLVNNITFNQENILLKTLPQTINGNVYIFNKYLNDNRILPLSFVNVHVESINGKNLSDFYQNVVYKDHPLTTINTRLEFQETLGVESVEFLADFHGVNINELINEIQLYRLVTNYSEHLEYMSYIGGGIVEALQAKRSYLETYRLKQVIFGNIKKIISIEVTSAERFDVFVMLNVTDINGFLNFYIFDLQSSELILDNALFGFKTKDMHILDIFSVAISQRDFLVVQTRNHFSGVVKHSFFTHFKGQFRNVYEMHGNISREIVELNTGTDDCFITFARHAKNAAIACAFFNKPGVLGFQQVDELYSPTGIVQVCAVTSPNRVEIAVLDLEGKISIWSMNQQHKFVRSQIIKTLHTTTHITIIRYKDFHYIAACSETMPAAVHLGSIEIYKSSATNYVNIQSIVIESPSRAELSVVSTTNDLVLYVLTDSITKPLAVYRYNGITNFKEFTTGVTLPRVQRINILKAKVLQREMVSIISEGVGVLIVEAKIK